MSKLTQRLRPHMRTELLISCWLIRPIVHQRAVIGMCVDHW